MAQDTPVDGASDTAPGEDIDYTREQIVVERDDAEGTVKLKLGESAMYVDYGDGRISFTATQTRYLGIADVYHQRQGFDKRVGIPAQTIVYQRLIGIIEYTDENDNGLFDVHGGKVAGTLDELRAAMVAANRADLLATMRWGYEWDIAAATLIAREAGAAVSDIFGQPLGYNKRDPRSFGLLVCAPGIQQQAIEHFGERARERLGTAKGPE